jgi:hypothetical protein
MKIMRPVLVHQHWWARQKNTTKFILIPVQVADGFLQTTIGLKKKDNQSALNPHLQIHFHPSTSTN